MNQSFSLDNRLYLVTVFFLVLFQLPDSVFAQKNDYVVLSDTILSQGNIKELPSNNHTQIFFRRSRKEEFKSFSIDDVSEFRMSNRMFFRKQIELHGQRQVIFLEQISDPIKGAVIWKLNGDTDLYLLEVGEEMKILDTDYKLVLSNELNNKDLIPLLDITPLDEVALAYLNKTVNTIKGPRTYTKYLVVTPYLGFTSQSVGFRLLDSDIPEKVTGSSLTIGINGEVFLDFKRKVSVLIGVSLSKFDSQEFFNYSRGQQSFESDVFMDFSLVQVPVMVRYYYDFKPNKMRFFAEMGYSLGFANYENLGVFQAEIFQDQTVITTRRSFEMGNEFAGITTGIGCEKYLSKHRGLALGLRQFNLIGDNESFVHGLIFHLGYKF